MNDGGDLCFRIETRPLEISNMQNNTKIPNIIVIGFNRFMKILAGVTLLFGLNACASTGTNSLYLHNSENAAKASAATGARCVLAR